MIRVLVVDDSPTSRTLLSVILGSDPEIQVIGEAVNGVDGVEQARPLRPDLVVMDINMPIMDGFEATKEIMITAPTPIIIVTSSMVARSVETSMHALRAGALAVLDKPPCPGNSDVDERAHTLLSNVKTLAGVKVVRHWRQLKDGGRRAEGGGESSSVLRPASSVLQQPRTVRIVVIATSTGGPAALHRILGDLPGEFPLPILVVQHMTAGFCTGLADWLNKESDLRVKVAEDGEALQARTVYFAADNRHLGLANRSQISLSDAAPIGGFRPSGTYLFTSAAQVFGASTLAMILTGMGEDGVEGLRAVRQAGGRILAQDEKTSVIFGMPGAAVAAGLPHEVLALEAIAPRLVELVSGQW